jgi:hypothetical protein
MVQTMIPSGLGPQPSGPMPPPAAAAPMPAPPQPSPMLGGGAAAAMPPGAQGPVTIDAVMELLRDGMTRRFRIDIETDSTITGDESQERQDRNEFITVTTKFMEAWGPMIQQNPLLIPMAGEFLKFGTRAYRVGRSLEEVIEETVDKLQAAAAQPKPPPQASPDEVVKAQTAQVKGQAEIVKARTEAQSTVQEAALKERSSQMEMASQEMRHQHKRSEHAMDMHRLNTEAVLAQQQPPTGPNNGGGG